MRDKSHRQGYGDLKNQPDKATVAEPVFLSLIVGLERAWGNAGVHRRRASVDEALEQAPVVYCENKSPCALIQHTGDAN